MVKEHRFVKVRRTMVDVSSTASRREGIRMYRPGRWILRGIPWLLGVFSFLPWHRFIKSRASFGDILPGFDLEAALGPVDFVTIYLGNGSEKSKFTLKVRLSGVGEQRFKVGHRDVIVKLANTEAAALAIRHEVDVLERLARTALCDQVPTIYGFVGVQGGWTWSVQSLLPRGASPNRLGPVHEKFLETLKSIGLSHGDFAPWNCAIVGGELVVWDWEDAGPWKENQDRTWFRKQVRELLGVEA